jgi:hypothetical protein
MGCRQPHADERISPAYRSDTSRRAGAIVDAGTVTGAREKGIAALRSPLLPDQA